MDVSERTAYGGRRRRRLECRGAISPPFQIHAHSDSKTPTTNPEGPDAGRARTSDTYANSDAGVTNSITNKSSAILKYVAGDRQKRDRRAYTDWRHPAAVLKIGIVGTSGNQYKSSRVFRGQGRTSQRAIVDEKTAGSMRKQGGPGTGQRTCKAPRRRAAARNDFPTTRAVACRTAEH